MAHTLKGLTKESLRRIVDKGLSRVTPVTTSRTED